MDYIDQLNSEFSKRKLKNELYSLRAFSMSLGISPGTLSNVLKRKRHIALKDILRVSELLSLAEKDKKLFIKTAFANRLNEKSAVQYSSVLETDSKTIIDPDKYEKFIKNWKYHLIIALFSMKTYKNDLSWMREKTGLSETEIIKILNDLVDMEFISKTKDGYSSSVNKTRTKPDIPSFVVREAHCNNLELAAKKIAKIEVENRDYRIVTMPVNIQKMKKAKELINQFLHDMEQLVEDEEASEIYRLSLQFFPLKR